METKLTFRYDSDVFELPVTGNLGLAGEQVDTLVMGSERCG